MAFLANKMNREIKFRGKSIVMGCFFFVNRGKVTDIKTEEEKE